MGDKYMYLTYYVLLVGIQEVIDFLTCLIVSTFLERVTPKIWLLCSLKSSEVCRINVFRFVLYHDTAHCKRYTNLYTPHLVWKSALCSWRSSYREIGHVTEIGM
jgi:hypothetical protein